jgi:hypothetical protein
MKRRIFFGAALAYATPSPLFASVRGKRWEDPAEVLAQATARKQVDAAVLHVVQRRESITRHFGKAGSGDAMFLLGFHLDLAELKSWKVDMRNLLRSARPKQISPGKPTRSIRPTQPTPRAEKPGKESRLPTALFPSTFSSRDMICPSWGRTPLCAAGGIVINDVFDPLGQRRCDGPTPGARSEGAYARATAQAAPRAKPFHLGTFSDLANSPQGRRLAQSPLGQAIGYALPQWDGLVRYCEDGELSIDNNLSERMIRPCAIGRKVYSLAP